MIRTENSIIIEFGASDIPDEIVDRINAVMLLDWQDEAGWAGPESRGWSAHITWPELIYLDVSDIVNSVDAEDCPVPLRFSGHTVREGELVAQVDEVHWRALFVSGANNLLCYELEQI